MDEPTNDLDLETLELLEELLIEYGGTILLVSHDRAFLNNVVSSTMVFEGNGSVREYPGGYEDWLNQRIDNGPDESSEKKSKIKSKKEKTITLKKLSFKEKKELESMPQLIERLESEQSDIFEKMIDPEFYKKDTNKMKRTKDRSEEIKEVIKNAYELVEITPLSKRLRKMELDSVKRAIARKKNKAEA